MLENQLGDNSWLSTKTCKNDEVGVVRDKSGACFWEGQGDEYFQACMAENQVSVFCRIFK